MHFVVTRHDKPNSLQLRLATRPRHLVYLEAVTDKIVYGGALLAADGTQMGSILVIDVPDMAAAREFADADPFVDAGLFAETLIEPFRPVFRDGKRID
ncbi:MAG: YciI family protein [Acetobacteraceae bacterium]|nr:YciI family protein [Pseudomonadota bacterium]